MADTPPILAILGSTASGKSALAMEVCRRVGGEVVSVDSMQVYRELDIGTAKPTAAERAEVGHHLIDLVAPNEPFTVARFVELADAAIADARRRGVPLVVTGGTPLYYKALFEGLFEGPGADETVRARLRELSGDELFARLQQVDPVAATRIHANDQRRLVRALEVYELTGQPISSFQTHWEEKNPPRHAAAWIGLDWDREVLNRRINSRTRAMMEAGWVQEVRALLEKYGSLSYTAAEATGYAELVAHVQGKMKLEEATEQVKIGTRQLARRQMKWLRRFPNVRWLRGDQPLETLAQEAIAVL